MKEKTLKKLFLVSGGLLTVLFCLGPFVYMILTALSQSPDYLLPDKPFHMNPDNFQVVLFSQSLHFPEYLRNSIIISAVSAGVAVALASPAAYAVSRLRLPGKNRWMILSAQGGFAEEDTVRLSFSGKQVHLFESEPETSPAHPTAKTFNT